MNDAEQAALVAEVQRQFAEKMATPEFKARAEATCARLEAGERMSNAEIAECLDIPERLIDIAMAAQGRKINNMEGADLSIWQLAAALNDSPQRILQCYELGLDLLLKSRSTEPTVAALIKTADFKRAVKKQRSYIDDDTTHRSMAADLKLPVEVMSWAFFEARTRSQIQPHRPRH
jgi:hypothetical protein